MYGDLLPDQLGVNFLGPAPLDLELLHMLTTFHWNALGSTLGWWFCHNSTVSWNEKFWVAQVTTPPMGKDKGWGRTRGASIGQVWTRHLAPAAPASRPSSPSQFHACPCHADSALQFVPSLVPGWGKSRAASTGFRALSPSDRVWGVAFDVSHFGSHRRTGMLACAGPSRPHTCVSGSPGRGGWGGQRSPLWAAATGPGLFRSLGFKKDKGGGGVHHPCILGGTQTNGDQIRIGCLTPAFSGAQPRAEMLHRPCILGDPQTKGDKIRIGCLTPTFSGAQKRAEMLCHPCILGGINTG